MIWFCFFSCLSVLITAYLCDFERCKVYGPAKFEIKSFILLLNANKVRPFVIYRQITEVYDNVMSNHNKESSGWLYVSCD